MAVQRADPDACASRDVFERRVRPGRDEGLVRSGHQELSVALGVRTHNRRSTLRLKLANCRSLRRVDDCGAGPAGDQPRPAGAFSTWLAGMQRALRREEGSDVPCDGCTACCTSSQFVHIGPDEVDTLAHIPAALLFPAPRAPKGNVLIGYDENGRCPMLGDGGCSIYEHRPRTCRTYDCRIFPATGVDLDDHSKRAIAERAARWRFEYPAELDRREQEALRAAAEFVREHEDSLPDDMTPVSRDPARRARDRAARRGPRPAPGRWSGGAAILIGPPRGGAVW